MAEHVPANSFLRQLSVVGVRAGRRVWVEGSGRRVRYYTWDALHDEVEVYNGRGKHLGAIDPVSRRFLKDAVEGRELEL